MVTVLEDDVLVSPDFLRHTQTIRATLPANWDLVQWGFIYHPLFIWLDLGSSKAKMEFFPRAPVSEIFSLEQGPPVAMKLAHSFGTQCYSVTPAGAEKLLQGIVPLRDRRIVFKGASVVIVDDGIDCAMCGVYERMQSFVCIPPLVVHDTTVDSERKSMNIEPTSKSPDKTLHEHPRQNHELQTA